MSDYPLSAGFNRLYSQSKDFSGLIFLLIHFLFLFKLLIYIVGLLGVIKVLVEIKENNVSSLQKNIFSKCFNAAKQISAKLLSSGLLHAAQHALKISF